MVQETAGNNPDMQVKLEQSALGGGVSSSVHKTSPVSLLISRDGGRCRAVGRRVGPASGVCAVRVCGWGVRACLHVTVCT